MEAVITMHWPLKNAHVPKALLDPKPSRCTCKMTNPPCTCHYPFSRHDGSRVPSVCSIVQSNTQSHPRTRHPLHALPSSACDVPSRRQHRSSSAQRVRASNTCAYGLSGGGLLHRATVVVYIRWTDTLLHRHQARPASSYLISKPDHHQQTFTATITRNVGKDLPRRSLRAPCSCRL